jgi:hypothetical protein
MSGASWSIEVEMKFLSRASVAEAFASDRNRPAASCPQAEGPSRPRSTAPHPLRACCKGPHPTAPRSERQHVDNSPRPLRPPLSEPGESLPVRFGEEEECSRDSGRSLQGQSPWLFDLERSLGRRPVDGRSLAMNLPRSVAEVLGDHVTLENESIDRMYLNLYVPRLQTVRGVVWYLRGHRRQRFASTATVAPMTEGFVKEIDRFARRNRLEIVSFEKGQRKDEVTQCHLARFRGKEGVLYIGRAQDKARVVRTERRRFPSGATYPWIVESTAMVNHFYFYCVDEDFGPFFLKFCTYFPYNAKLCINGNEYAKRQLQKRGIGFEPLDNGIRWCEDPKALQQICDGLTEAKIDRLLRKWLAKLPHPFPRGDRRAGYCYELSILQAEFSLTQVLDRPVAGRVFFEEVIRENLDIGRPGQAQLIFDRRVTRRTPGRFRTRVLTEGVTPSLHVDYKRSRIKQYHKEGQALRTETTINDTRDFGIGRRIHNLPALRRIGFQANRRLLDVQRISHDCALGEDAFQNLQRPREVNGRRASALRFGDTRVQALLHALLLFVFVARGFSNKDLREQIAPLLGLRAGQIRPGRMSYDLRRLRLHGLVERLPGTHRYRLTPRGLRTALFYTRVYARILRPGLALVSPQAVDANHQLRRSFEAAQTAINRWCDQTKIAA